MPYRNNIPQATDTFEQSQADMIGNFRSIQDTFEVDHGPFNSIVQGMHRKVSFNETTTPVIPAGEIGMYAITPALPLPTTGRTELVLVKEDGTNLLLTGRDAAATGWCYLPSGLILKWGTDFIVGNAAITFPVANSIPVFNNVFNAQVCIVNPNNIDSDNYVIVSSFNTTTLTVFVTNRTTTGADSGDINYFVIGN